jgi:hypothetical protein
MELPFLLKNDCKIIVRGFVISTLALLKVTFTLVKLFFFLHNKKKDFASANAVLRRARVAVHKTS